MTVVIVKLTSGSHLMVPMVRVLTSSFRLDGADGDGFDLIVSGFRLDSDDGDEFSRIKDY